MLRLLAPILGLLLMTTIIVAGDSILIRENPVRHRVSTGFTFTISGASPIQLSVLLPLPDSDSYQDVIYEQILSGTIQTVPETGEKYLRHLALDGDYVPNQPVVAELDYEVVTYDVRVDFDRLGTLLPYDTAGPEYRRFTGTSGEYIDPDHPDVTTIVRTLDSTARDDVDFARSAYEYVKKNYRYVPNSGGLRPLATVLANRGGECGNLSSILISILRGRGMPARHVLGFKTSGEPHVYAEFYLQSHGWIPVDVTYGIARPDLDFFGRLSNSDPMIILSRGAWVTVDGVDGSQRISCLHQGKYWWRTAQGTAVVNGTFSFRCR